MSNISNVAKMKNPIIRAIRGTLEHRAQWLYLNLKEVEKKGITWEEAGMPAIRSCGSIHGRKLVQSGGSRSFKGLKKTLFTLPARMVFEMKILKTTDDELKIDFGYCPLVGAWQELGCDDDQIARLCDIAMEGDRGIARAFGGRLELGRTIANGHDRCELCFIKGDQHG